MLKRFVKGLAVGSVVGGSLGLLFAPRSGNKTRKMLIEEMNEATELTEELNSSLNRFNHSLKNLQETAADTVPTFVRETQKAAENFRFQAEPRVMEMTKQIEKIKQTLPVE